MKIPLTILTVHYNSNYSELSHIIGIFSNKDDLNQAINNYKSKSLKELTPYHNFSTKEYILDHAY